MAGVAPGALAGLAWVLWIWLPHQGCFLELQMAGRTQLVYLNHNVTIFCKVPGSPHLDITTVGITWFRKSDKEEIKLFEYFGNHQQAFRPGAIVSPRRLERGDASLQLPRVQLMEAGEYWCELVVTPQKAKGWVLLEVIASPLSSLFPVQTVVTERKDTYILCTASCFYPEDINITWNKWTQKGSQHLEFSDHVISGPTVENKDGTFNVTSSLKLQPSLEDNMTVYQCVIGHTSLHSSQKFNFTLIVLEHEKTTSHYTVGAVSVIVLFLLLLCCFLWNRRKKQNERGNSEEAVKSATYTAVFVK